MRERARRNVPIPACATLHEFTRMEPQLVAAVELLEGLDALQRRDPLFHKPEIAATRREVEAMTDDVFWEVGGERPNKQASGLIKCGNFPN